MTLKEKLISEVGEDEAKAIMKDYCPQEKGFANNRCDGDDCDLNCGVCWEQEETSEKVVTTEVKIAAYDEDYLYLNNGEKIAAPFGYKFNPDDIKKILEAE